jgi:DNA adenine methylase
MSKPFLKWVGGKSKMLRQILPHFPDRVEKYYFEPFLGSGAVFFALKARQPDLKAVLSDANEELINAFIQVRDNVDALIGLLQSCQTWHEMDRAEFYEMLVKKRPYKRYGPVYNFDCPPDWDGDGFPFFDNWNDPIQRAARFIAINKTAYSGIWRVNKEGQFNVPYGAYPNPKICDDVTLRACSALLQDTVIKCCSYVEVLTQDVWIGDVVYLDPPYDGTYSGYTSAWSHKEDTQAIQRIAHSVAYKGATVIMSNSDTETIRSGFDSPIWTINTVKRSGAINSNAKDRGKQNELVIKAG